MQISRLPLIAAALLVSAHSAAQTQAPAGALACTQISDPAARLACYDRSMGAQLPPTQPLPEPDETKATIDIQQSIEQSRAESTPKVVLTEAPAAPTQPQAFSPLTLAYDLAVNH